jgi:sugar phosphate isomerase/epimerase
MARPVTLFTGQWADLPFETVCAKAKQFGYDGIELPCWGDHFEVDKALKDKNYCKGRWDILTAHGLKAYAIANHLVGQAVCDNIDERHKAILPAEVWGDGEPEGVRQRAAQKLIDTAKACRAFIDAAPKPTGFPAVVTGFTGSSIWHSIYAFPPTDQKYWQKGFDDFARRFLPILDAFDKANVNFGLEVHPTEIAFDIASAQRAIDAVKGHKRFGFNYDPSHLGYQHVDYVKFLRTFGPRIFHVHVKDAWWGHGDGTVGVFGGHTTFSDARRYWDFRSPDINYQGPLSVEWEDSRMDREHGATEAAAFVKKIDFKPSAIAFDAQFDR